LRKVRVYVDEELLGELKLKFPETEGLTWSGTVNVVLRKALKQVEKERER